VTDDRTVLIEEGADGDFVRESGAFAAGRRWGLRSSPAPAEVV
jgi:hypothetical protein